MDNATTLAEVITIGDEILYGQITDTNSQWISRELDSLGIRILRKTLVGDTVAAIRQALDLALAETDLVIFTGGLGPTKDDVTKKTLAEYFGTQLVMHEDTLAKLKAFFEQRGRELNALNHQQAMLPEDCTVLPNTKGTAMGMWFERDGKVVISLPGVPHEMKYLMEAEALPRLRTHFRTTVIYHKIVRTVGVPESILAEKIADWESGLPAHIKLAYLPNYGQVRLRLTAQGQEEATLIREVEEQIEALRPMAGKYIFGYDTTTLEEAIGALLMEKGKTMATAESCTGGHVAHLVTSVPGSSRYFMGSVVAYDNAVKQKALGVAEETLVAHGAVSEETVLQMAAGVREKMGTSIGLATSGVAGPGGGSPEKPVGTVWIAYADEKGAVAKKLQLTQDRMINIRLSSTAVLNLARLQLNQT
ncbi:MAG: competence/damage-inducible protein A [Bacteroidota bacterium]